VLADVLAPDPLDDGPGILEIQGAGVGNPEVLRDLADLHVDGDRDHLRATLSTPRRGRSAFESTSAINSDKTGTLTMNQMTAVEVVDPTDRYTISGSGYELEGQVHHAAGSSDTIEDAILPYVVASDATLVDGKVVGDPTEGALLVLAHKAGLDIDTTRERLPRLATLPFDPRS